MSSIATAQGYNPEAIGLVEAGEAPVEQNHGLLESIRGSRLGTMVAIAGSAIALMAGAEKASASVPEGSGHSTSTIVNTDTGVTIRAGHAWQKDVSGAYVNIMGNHRVVSKAEVEEAKQEGDCFWVNGKKTPMWTEGISASGVGMGRDYRKNLVCKVDKDVNGDGKVNDEDLVRAACGNEVTLEQPKTFLDHVVWVEGKGLIRIKVKAKAEAEATCTTSDGLASASAHGFGLGSAYGRLKMKGSTKTIVKNAQNKLDSKVEQAINGKGKAKANAFADANAQCIEKTGQTPPPSNEVPPKDGTQGQGTITPGQPGGPGAGGEPGDPTNGEICRDDAGNVVTGPADQFGNCY